MAYGLPFCTSPASPWQSLPARSLCSQRRPRHSLMLLTYCYPPLSSGASRPRGRDGALLDATLHTNPRRRCDSHIRGPKGSWGVTELGQPEATRACHKGASHLFARQRPSPCEQSLKSPRREMLCGRCRADAPTPATLHVPRRCSHHNLMRIRCRAHDAPLIYIRRTTPNEAGAHECGQASMQRCRRHSGILLPRHRRRTCGHIRFPSS